MVSTELSNFTSEEVTSQIDEILKPLQETPNASLEYEQLVKEMSSFEESFRNIELSFASVLDRVNALEQDITELQKSWLSQ